MQRLDDQVAVVTGGARGIGLGIASVLARAGAHVVLADIDPVLASSAAATLRETGLSAEGARVDVTDRASVDALAEQLGAVHGRIDILAANAGIYPSMPFGSIDDAEWDRVMDLNVKGALHAAQACLPAMLARGYGRIVFTSSITGPITGQTGFAAYGASKAALLGMLRSLAAIPMGRFGTPDDIGHAVRYLASPEASYVTGQTIVVDGGQVLPEGSDV